MSAFKGNRVVHEFTQTNPAAPEKVFPLLCPVREADWLIQRINRTNSASRFGDGTLADALAERDVLRIRYNAYRELATAASTTQGRTTRSEVKFIRQ